MSSYLTGRSKVAKRLFGVARASALVALVVAITAAPAGATSITMNYSPEHEVNDFVFGNPLQPNYIFRVGFDEVLSFFQLTITDNIVSSGFTQSFDDISYKCVDMTLVPAEGDYTPSCVTFSATGDYGPTEDAPPIEDVHYAGGEGAINIGVAYSIWGFPNIEDPVDIGQTNDFSDFMVFAHIFEDFTDFKLAHLHDGDTSFEDITFGEHCDGFSINRCARDNNFSFTSPVPEPSSILLFGMSALGLAWFKRRESRSV